MPDLAHEKSMLGSSPELELFDLPLTEVSILDHDSTEYKPIASITDNDPIEFFISGASDTYIDLSQSLLEVQIKVTKSDGTDLADTSKVSTANLCLHSLFSQVDIFLNEKLVSASDRNYSYRSYIETVLNYGTDAKFSQLRTEGYYKDDGPEIDEGNDPTSETAPLGLKERSKFIKKSATWQLIGRIHADIFTQPLYLINGVDVRLKLTRNKDAFVLISSEDDASYKITLQHASFYIRKVTLSPDVLLSHAKKLQQENVKYPIRRVLTKVFTIPKGSMQASLDNAFLGQHPARLVMGLISNASYNGSYKTNPFNFKPFKLNFLNVLVDGKSFPTKPFQPDFDKSLFIREYLTLYQSTGRYLADRGLDIGIRDFGSGYTFFSFDLTPDGAASGGYFHLLKQGTVRIDLRFQSALTETVNLVVFAEFQSIIEIDAMRNVITEF